MEAAPGQIFERINDPPCAYIAFLDGNTRTFRITLAFPGYFRVLTVLFRYLSVVAK